MSSSDLVAVVTPAVALPLLFFWVLGVFYADSHPAWRPGQQSRSHLRTWLPRAQASTSQATAGPLPGGCPALVSVVLLPWLTPGCWPRTEQSVRQFRRISSDAITVR